MITTSLQLIFKKHKETKKLRIILTDFRGKYYIIKFLIFYHYIL